VLRRLSHQSNSSSLSIWALTQKVGAGSKKTHSSRAPTQTLILAGHPNPPSRQLVPWEERERQLHHRCSTSPSRAWTDSNRCQLPTLPAASSHECCHSDGAWTHPCPVGGGAPSRRRLHTCRTRAHQRHARSEVGLPHVVASTSAELELSRDAPGRRWRSPAPLPLTCQRADGSSVGGGPLDPSDPCRMRAAVPPSVGLQPPRRPLRARRPAWGLLRCTVWCPSLRRCCWNGKKRRSGARDSHYRRRSGVALLRCRRPPRVPTFPLCHVDPLGVIEMLTTGG
jgi:hypothetical protein